MLRKTEMKCAHAEEDLNDTVARPVSRAQTTPEAQASPDPCPSAGTVLRMLEVS